MEPDVGRRSTAGERGVRLGADRVGLVDELRPCSTGWTAPVVVVWTGVIGAVVVAAAGDEQLRTARAENEHEMTAIRASSNGAR